ncbi:Multidrug resistance-associated protein 4 [Coemansia sp. RSA 2522]|nr:Multidrug resistance-associated protein 4 [Coemansia sp. RSA 2522]
MCRLLLRKHQIVVLDEATADVDLNTDKDIQSVINKEFGNCTVLTIAHRLETVMNSDRIVVMNKGEIVEVGPPQELIAKGGYFAELVQSSNFVAKQALDTLSRMDKIEKVIGAGVAAHQTLLDVQKQLEQGKKLVVRLNEVEHIAADTRGLNVG